MNKLVCSLFVIFLSLSSFAEESESITLHFQSDADNSKCDFYHNTEQQRDLMMKSIKRVGKDGKSYKCLSSLPEDRFTFCTLSGIDFQSDKGICRAWLKDKRFNIETTATKGILRCTFFCSNSSL